MIVLRQAIEYMTIVGACTEVGDKLLFVCVNNVCAHTGTRGALNTKKDELAMPQ